MTGDQPQRTDDARDREPTAREQRTIRELKAIVRWQDWLYGRRRQSEPGS